MPSYHFFHHFDAISKGLSEEASLSGEIEVEIDETDFEDCCPECGSIEYGTEDACPECSVKEMCDELVHT
jgi:transposase